MNSLLPRALKQHAGDHRGNERQHARRAGCEVLNRRPWAQSDQTPPDTKQDRAADQGTINMTRRRP